MDVNALKGSLCEIIAEIQAISGLACPALSGDTKPASDVKDFSSEIWPIAIAMLEDKTGIAIPEDDNLFYDPKSKAILTIDECATRVLALSKKQQQQQEEESQEGQQ